MKNMISKIRNVYVPAAAGAIGVGLASVNAFALSWPPTASDVGAELTTIGADIGTILGVAVTAGLVLYAGVLAVQAAIGFFSKFVKRSTAG